MRKEKGYMTDTILRTCKWAALLACTVSLSACSQLGFEEFSQDTSPPALNLVTGCFSTINPTGKTYIFTGCLTQEELASLSEYSGSPSLRETVKRAHKAHQASLKPYPHHAGAPMLDLVTGCIAPGDNKDRAYADIPCLKPFELYKDGVFTPGVLRKVEAVREAHQGAMRAVNALPKGPVDDGFAVIPG